MISQRTKKEITIHKCAWKYVAIFVHISVCSSYKKHCIQTENIERNLLFKWKDSLKSISGKICFKQVKTDVFIYLTENFKVSG